MQLTPSDGCQSLLDDFEKRIGFTSSYEPIPITDEELEQLTTMNNKPHLYLAWFN